MKAFVSFNLSWMLWLWLVQSRAEGVPERIANPDVARDAMDDVEDLGLLVEGGAGLALVGGGLVSSSHDGKCLVDGLAREFLWFLAGLLISISRQVRPSTMIRVFRSVGMDPY